MVTQQAHSTAVGGLDQRTMSPSAVVFRGDGEPKSPKSMVNRLSDIVSDSGIDADSYTMGGVIEELERRFADLLGKEAAVFFPTGTLANHLAIRRLCSGRPRAIVQQQSHLYNDTGDCVQRLSGIHLVPIAADRPYFTLDEVRAVVEASDAGRVTNPVGALMIESPVRRQFGQIMPVDEMRQVTDYCRDLGIGTHLDGARLFMMSAATGIAPAAYAAMFDTVYVSLYKYFGAPFGAVLAGDEQLCSDLYHDRRMFGSGLSSSALAAALALSGLDGFEGRFGDAMSKACSLFESLNELSGISVGTYEHGSNIFPLRLEREVEIERFVTALANRDVFVGPDESNSASIHLTVNTTILRQTNSDLIRAFEAALHIG